MQSNWLKCKSIYFYLKTEESRNKHAYVRKMKSIFTKKVKQARYLKP